MAAEPQRQPWPRNWTVYIMNVLTRINMSASGVSKKIINMANGSAGSQDASTVKQMEDHVLAAIGDNVSKSPPMSAATTGALPANTRTGDVLKADAVGAFPTIDGVPPAPDQDYLVKDEGGGASHINNGIYTLTVVGDGATEWELTRRHDMEGGEGASGAMCPIASGTGAGDTTFKCINNIGSDVVNIDALEFWWWGQTTSHTNLKDVTSDQHHTKSHAHNGADGSGTVAHSDTTGQGADDHHDEDTFARQAKVFFVSDNVGNDANDGSEFKQFKTLQAAYDAGGGFDLYIHLDNNTFTPYTVTIASALPSLHIDAYGPGVAALGGVTINMIGGCIVYVDNIKATFVEENGQATNGNISIYGDALLDDVKSFGGGNPTKTNINLFGCHFVMGGGSEGHLNNAAVTKGWTFDPSSGSGEVVVWSPSDFKSNKITNLADGVGAQDGAALGQIGTAIGTHSGLPNAHHTPPTLPGDIENGGGSEMSVADLSGVLADDQHIIDAEAVTAMGAKGDGNPLNHDRYTDGEVDTIVGTHAALPNAHHTPPTLPDDIENGGSEEMSLAGLSGEPADTVNKTLFDAQTLLRATADDTPTALTVAEQRLVGRITAGNIEALTVAQVLTMLNVNSETNKKAGIVASGSFAGVPRKATVTFNTAMPDNNYAISIMGEDSRNFSIESKVAGSFVINSNSAVAMTGNTFWIVRVINDP